MGWSFSFSGEATQAYNTWVHTYDAERRYGPANRSGYSNPDLDRLIEEASVILDDKVRDKKLQEATKIISEQYIYLPIIFPNVTVAARKGMVVSPRIDDQTLAMTVNPVP
jgi:peptide/nickel transport system substrate-binding protein